MPAPVPAATATSATSATPAMVGLATGPAVRVETNVWREWVDLAANVTCAAPPAEPSEPTELWGATATDTGAAVSARQCVALAAFESNGRPAIVSCHDPTLVVYQSYLFDVSGNPDRVKSTWSCVCLLCAQRVSYYLAFQPSSSALTAILRYLTARHGIAIVDLPPTLRLTSLATTALDTRPSVCRLFIY